MLFSTLIRLKVFSAALLAPKKTVSLKTAGSHPDKSFAGRRPGYGHFSLMLPERNLLREGALDRAVLLRFT